MSYNSATKHITAPVSIKDLQQCFGLSDTDLGTLISKANINPFARYKPVPYAKVGIMTEAERRSVAHGFDISEIIFEYNAVTQDYIEDAANNSWGYLVPNGGSAQPFRLADFALNGSVGYIHDAVPFLQVVYPSGGWTIILGQSSYLSIRVDSDPADSSENLQAEDLVSSILDLNEWKFVAGVRETGHWYESDDYILDDGEPTGTNILIPFTGTTGTRSYTIDVALHRYYDGKHQLVPIPNTSDYPSAGLTVMVKDDATQGGGGIDGGNTEEMLANVQFSYALSGTYKTGLECTDGGNPIYSLGSNGDLYVGLTLTNKSGSTSTITRSSFTINIDGTDVTPTTMYNSSKSVASSINIANNGSALIFLFFDDLFTRLGGEWTNTQNSPSKLNLSWSFDLKRNSAYLIGADLYAYYNQNPEWTSRR